MDNLLIRLAELPKELPQIYRVRYLVFQIEQGVDPTLEFDGKDESAQHVLAYLHQKAVGTARIRSLDAQTAKLERVAVLPEVRGVGIGRKIMDYSLQLLADQQIQCVYIHAQVAVQSFYERLGFESEGTVFEEAGISHITMKKLLC